MQTEYKNLKRPLTDTPNGVRPFPVGYYQLHPDVTSTASSIVFTLAMNVC